MDSTRPLRHNGPVTEGVVRSPNEARDQLARAIIAARGRLRVTQEEFAARAGLSLKTVQRIELRKIAPQTKTLTGLDRGAGWKPGSARRLYEDGRRPVLDGDREDWSPVVSDEQIVAMDAQAFAAHYVRLDREYGKVQAEDWLFHALDVRRAARRVGDPLAGEGHPS